MSEFLYKPKYTFKDEIVTLVADITHAISVIGAKATNHRKARSY